MIFFSCSTTEPENPRVQYYAIISPSDDPTVLKTISYTSASGVDEQENTGVLNRTISLPSGTVINLSASGTASSVLNIRIKLEIHIDGVLVASEEKDGVRSLSAAITATVP